MRKMLSNELNSIELKDQTISKQTITKTRNNQNNEQQEERRKSNSVQGKPANNQKSTSSQGCVLFFNLPPLINNSTLVKQRASAKDLLAAASVTTGASLPLMIGGRSKLVINSITSEHKPPLNALNTFQPSCNQSAACFVTAPSQIANQSGGPTISTQSIALASTAGPKNTALRAEQRKQNTNMVSVVRPVMMNNSTATSNHINSDQHVDLNRKRFSSDQADFTADSQSWQKAQAGLGSILDDFILMDQRIKSNKLSSSATMDNLDNLNTDHLLILDNQTNFQTSFEFQNEAQQRQQMALLRREEFELNRSIKRQHSFFLNKICERKRNLEIVHSVWYQRDLKHAIEKLIDIYHQGLIFNTFDTSTPTDRQTNKQLNHIITNNRKPVPTLNSLNSPLVVDVLSVLILRPKLWNLDICQLILPIIINDLLLQQNNKSQTTKSRYEYYVEIALKTLKLILTNFGTLIKTTIESQKECEKLVIGVDLNREDRLSKCLNCYKLLAEAKEILSTDLTAKQKSVQVNGINNNEKFALIYSELDKLLTILFDSSTHTVNDQNQIHRKYQQRANGSSISLFRRQE